MSRVHYALCNGAGLRICDSCRRHVEHNPAAASAPHQPFVAPTTGSRCAQWMARPATAGAIR